MASSETTRHVAAGASASSSPAVSAIDVQPSASVVFLCFGSKRSSGGARGSGVGVARGEARLGGETREEELRLWPERRCRRR
jgi:hypothetical protein